MSKTTYERGKTLTHPSIYPTLTFTPIFGHRGDFVWIEEVKVAWPEHDSEFAFVSSTVHDERVDNLKAKNAELRELVKDMWQTISRDDRCGWDMDANCCASNECTVSCRYWYRMKELGIEAEL